MTYLAFCGRLPWGRLFSLAAFFLWFVFCWSLSTNFFIWFVSFSSSRQDRVSAFSFHSSLQRSIKQAAWRLLMRVLQIFFFSWSDVIQVSLNQFSVRTVDFSDYFTACEFILRFSLFTVSVDASSLSRGLVMLHDVEVALVSSVDHGSHLTGAFYSHRETQSSCQES